MNTPLKTFVMATFFIAFYFSLMAFLGACNGKKCWSRTVAFDLTEELSSIWACCEDTAFVAGNPGIYLYDGDSWTRDLTFPSSDLVADVWGTSPSNVYAVTWGGLLYRFDGETWEEQGYFPGSSLYSIWGADSTLFITGQRDDMGIVFTYTEGAWQEYVSDTSRLINDVWACSPTEALAVGSDSVILEYDGIEWSGAELGQSGAIQSVWGTSCSEAFFAGYKVYRLLDGVLTEEAVGDIGGFRHIWGRSPTDIFAVGQEGRAVHYDGTEWTDISSDSDIDLEAVSGFQEGKVFAVGSAWFGEERHGVVQEYTCE